MNPFASLVVSVLLSVSFSGLAEAQKSDAQLTADAESAGPTFITKNATIKTMDGRVLRKGTSEWTCYSGSKEMGPMCNPPEWDALVSALMAKKPADIKKVSISYMLAGDAEAPGVSNKDPYATKPTADNDWVKEGPHLMIAVPDPALLEGISTNPKDPVYVMWKGTPYAHIMVKIAEEQK